MESQWRITDQVSYCYQIVLAHDGRITVDSTVGKGSVFTVVLPYM